MIINEQLFPDTIEWLIALLGAWAVLSLPVTKALDKLKPALTALLAFVGVTSEELSKSTRTLVIIVLVFVASVIVVYEGNVNIFDVEGSPYDFNQDLEELVTVLFLAAGTFGWHDVWSWWGKQED